MQTSNDLFYFLRRSARVGSWQPGMFCAPSSAGVFPFRQFFDFRFGVNASRFFNLPHPIQTQHNQRDPRCPSRNLLLPRFSLLLLGDTIENEY
jgi:hypothetical protein